jgi:hypothetical protein
MHKFIIKVITKQSESIPGIIRRVHYERGHCQNVRYPGNLQESSRDEFRKSLVKDSSPEESLGGVFPKGLSQEPLGETSSQMSVNRSETFSFLKMITFEL